MNPELKVCKNCSATFTIQPEDFSFYQKINVPPPTECPACRCVRRMVHRNERNLFRRKCDVTGKDIISIYRADCPYTICDQEYYFSDAYDPMKFGVSYDSSRKFFEQFYDFAKKVPLASLFVRTSENCAYNQDVSNASNCYLSSRTHDSKNVLYGYRVNKSSDCTDCFQAIEGSEFLYECVNAAACSNSQFLHFCEKCSDSAFLYNCVGCVDCFMCTDLRNKQYHYKNEAYSPEEYKKKVAEHNLSTRRGLEKTLSEFEDFITKFPRKNLTITRSNNVTGDTIADSKDSHYVFNVRGLENSSYIWDSMKFKDSMDTYSGASVELVYESTATTGHSSNCHFCVRVYKGSRDCEYSWFLLNCSNCFGCIGLQNKEYCIFNVQYTEEEYKELLAKIKLRMLVDKEYGEFFPLYISPFPFNDTVAQEYYPITKEEAEQRGLVWGEMADKNYQPTISGDALPDDLKNVQDSVLKEIISCIDGGNCTHGCTKAYRITADELAYYRRKNIPLPEKCPNCRYYRRLAYRNPTIIRQATCMCAGENSTNGLYKNNSVHDHGENACNLDIDTTYPDGRGTIIYCEACYKKEVF
jgi:hypothetical protein